MTFPQVRGGFGPLGMVDSATQRGPVRANGTDPLTTPSDETGKGAVTHYVAP